MLKNKEILQGKINLLNNLIIVNIELSYKPLKNFGKIGLETLKEKTGFHTYLKKGDYEFNDGFIHYICIEYTEFNNYGIKREFEEISFSDFKDIIKNIENRIKSLSVHIEKIKTTIKKENQIIKKLEKIIELKKDIGDNYDYSIVENIKNNIKDSYYLKR